MGFAQGGQRLVKLCRGAQGFVQHTPIGRTVGQAQGLPGQFALAGWCLLKRQPRQRVVKSTKVGGRGQKLPQSVRPQKHRLDPQTGPFAGQVADKRRMRVVVVQTPVRLVKLGLTLRQRVAQLVKNDLRQAIVRVQTIGRCHKQMAFAVRVDKTMRRGFHRQTKLPSGRNPNVVERIDIPGEYGARHALHIFFLRLPNATIFALMCSEQAAVLPSVSPPLQPLRRADGQTVTPKRRCLLMGIVNVTPDSFSDGGLFDTPSRALAHAEKLCSQGADVLDFGAESTRPQARLLTAKEEWERLQPVLHALPKAGLPAVLSIDTRHAETAMRASDLGFAMLNLAFPQHLFSPTLDSVKAAQMNLRKRRALLARFDAVVVMHSRGTPATMRDLADYPGDPCDTVIAELTHAARMLTDDEPALSQRIVFDPGLGFAKTAGQSLWLLQHTARLRQTLRRPILIGASRKSMWQSVAGLSSRLIPSVVGAAYAALAGADLVRVHDVEETRLGIETLRALFPEAAEPQTAQLAQPAGGQGA